MMLPEGARELLLSEQQMQDLREVRNKTRLPKSLSALAINSVYTNFNRFVNVPDSPLKYLRNTIVQQLLSRIASEIQEYTMKMPDPLLRQLLGLLVNPFITELDCTVFDALNYGLVKHALGNCPKIRKIKMENVHIEFNDCYKRPGLLPLESLKKSWNDLTTIILLEGDYFDDCDMMFLLENFPSIEELIIDIFFTHCPSTVLDHLINMKRLHTLKLSFAAASASVVSALPKFIIDVAGTVPSLQNFDFKDDNENDKFIDSFGEKYPCKKLLMEKLRYANELRYYSLKEGLKRKWPKNLSVKQLLIECVLRDTEIENLSTIECTFDLTMKFRGVQQMYKVMDCIGRLVESLTIHKMNEDSEIILERVLTTCPNLEHFKFSHPRSVVQDPNYNISPAVFKNCKSFELFDCSDDDDHYEHVDNFVLQQVFRKFLINTEVCEELKEIDIDELKSLAKVALAYPESLQQLRELRVCRPYFLQRNFHEDNKELIVKKYCKYFYELLTSCHKLERIFLDCPYPVFAGKATLVNRYLATINSIDPDFIEYSK